MLTLTPRMAHSPKLISFVARCQAEEVNNIRELLFALRSKGRIDYVGSTSDTLGYGNRIDAPLSVHTAVNKCEFWEPEALITTLRELLPAEWHPLLATLAPPEEDLPDPVLDPELL